MNHLPINNPTYMLAPNWIYHPGESIALGNIIADPSLPHLAISRPPSKNDLDKEGAASLPKIQKHTDTDWRLAAGSRRNLSAGLWATFLDIFGVRLRAERGRISDADYTMNSLQTVYFTDLPSQAYVRQCIAAEPELRELMRLDNLFGRPVYMITGLKIARGFSLSANSSSATGGSAKAGAGTGDAAAGGEFAASRETAGQLNFSSASDIVFAYQLMKIKPKGWKQKRLERSEYHSSAAFLGDRDGEDGEDGSEQEQFEAEWDFPDVEDLKILDTEFSEKQIVDDEENIVRTCITFEGDEDDY